MDKKERIWYYKNNDENIKIPYEDKVKGTIYKIGVGAFGWIDENDFADTLWLKNKFPE